MHKRIDENTDGKKLKCKKVMSILVDIVIMKERTKK